MPQVRDYIPANVQDAIDKIPPDAWPLINLTAKITVGVTLVWLAFALVAWWRRRAYNLTIASTARRKKKAQPDFLKVDKKARAAAIERGHDHEDELEERERIEAAIEAGKDPVSWGAQIGRIAALLMSIFTLICTIMGIVGNVGQMEQSVQKLTASGKIEYVIRNHMLATVIILFVVGYNVWHYFKNRKWEEQ